jgi:hypothetical protein
MAVQYNFDRLHREQIARMKSAAAERAFVWLLCAVGAVTFALALASAETSVVAKIATAIASTVS